MPVSLTLSRTRTVSMTLTGPGAATLAIETASDELVMALAPVLRARSVLGVTELDDGAEITITLDDNKVYPVTIVGNRTMLLAGGVAALDGKPFVIEVTQGAPGGWGLTFSGDFVFGSDVQSIDLSTAEGKTDCIVCMYRHGVGVRVMGFTRGF